MHKRREVNLPSGAILRIQVAPFAVSKALYQAVLRELQPLQIKGDMEVPSLIKDLFCVGLSSLAVEQCLWECFKSCTYDAGQGERKLSQEVLEPVEARDDYMTICVEVAKDNIGPFTKSLYADYQKLAELMSSFEKSRA